MSTSVFSLLKFSLSFQSLFCCLEKQWPKPEWNKDAFIEDILQFYLQRKLFKLFSMFFNIVKHFIYFVTRFKTYIQDKLQKSWDPIVSLFLVGISCFFCFRGVASSWKTGPGLVLVHCDLGWIFKQVGSTKQEVWDTVDRCFVHEKSLRLQLFVMKFSKINNISVLDLGMMSLNQTSIFGLLYPLPWHSLFINQGLVIKGSQLPFVSSCFWFTHSGRRKSSCCKHWIHNSLTAHSIFRAGEAAMGTNKSKPI